MSAIGILGAGQAGRVLAQALARLGHDVVIANSRDPRTLDAVVAEIGGGVRAAWAADAAAGADIAVTAFPFAPASALPVDALAGKIVLDTNNYMAWRDGAIPAIDQGQITEHELRQAQLPTSHLAKAFSHIQFHGRSPLRTPEDALPALTRLARPAGDPERIALAVASDHADATAAALGLYDQLGFDGVDAGALRESWRFGPGTPAWVHSIDGQRRDDLLRYLRLARRRGI